MCHGGEIDDAWCGVAAHELGHLAAEEEGADEIGLQDAVDRGCGGEQGMVHRGDARVVEQGIDATVLLLEVASHFDHGGFIGDIELVVVVVGGFDVGFPAAATGHAPPGVEEVKSEEFAYALSCAGYDDCLHARGVY